MPTNIHQNPSGLRKHWALCISVETNPCGNFCRQNFRSLCHHLGFSYSTNRTAAKKSFQDLHSDVFDLWWFLIPLYFVEQLPAFPPHISVDVHLCFTVRIHGYYFPEELTNSNGNQSLIQKHAACKSDHFLTICICWLTECEFCPCIIASWLEPAGRQSTRTKEWLSTSIPAMDGPKEIQRQLSEIWFQRVDWCKFYAPQNQDGAVTFHMQISAWQISNSVKQTHKQMATWKNSGQPKSWTTNPKKRPQYLRDLWHS